MSLTVIRGITNAGKTSALVRAVNEARGKGRTVRLCVPDSVQTRALPALSEDRILSARDSTSAAIDLFATSSVFGVSAFGTDLGLRIMEGLGLVAVT